MMAPQPASCRAKYRVSREHSKQDKKSYGMGPVRRDANMLENDRFEAIKARQGPKTTLIQKFEKGGNRRKGTPQHNKLDIVYLEIFKMFWLVVWPNLHDQPRNTDIFVKKAAVFTSGMHGPKLAIPQ